MCTLRVCVAASRVDSLQCMLGLDLMLVRAQFCIKLFGQAPARRFSWHSRSHRCVGAANKPSEYCFVATQESATQRLASLLALDLRASDCYCLLGEVGSGKSVFRSSSTCSCCHLCLITGLTGDVGKRSRAFIRSAFDDEEMPVPSPTYLLQQVYEGVTGMACLQLH